MLFLLFLLTSSFKKKNFKKIRNGFTLIGEIISKNYNQYYSVKNYEQDLLTNLNNIFELKGIQGWPNSKKIIKNIMGNLSQLSAFKNESFYEIFIKLHQQI